MTVGQVTTPVFRLGGLIPGSVLYLRQRSPAGGGAPESSPSVVLWGGAAFTALGDVNCFHERMSFLVAAWQAPGLPATERASHMSPPTICLIVPNRQLKCNSVSDSSFVGFALDWPSSRRRCRWLGSAFEVWRSIFSAHASLFRSDSSSAIQFRTVRSSGLLWIGRRAGGVVVGWVQRSRFGVRSFPPTHLSPHPGQVC